MTYTTGTSTGSSEDESIPTLAVQRTQLSPTFNITAGGVQHTRYRGREFTADPGPRETLDIQPLRDKISKVQQHSRTNKPALVAAREHVARLLRECQRISRELYDSDDPIESALLGGHLTNSLHELWNYRRCRESDWIETLNVLQIAVPAEEFEFLPKAKRAAIVKVFNEALLARTVGPTELDRCLRILTNAGFNVWGGLSDNG